MSSESDGMAKENGPDAPWLMDPGSSHEVAPEDGGPPEAPTQPAGSSSASVHVNGGEEWANGSMREASMSRISFFVSSSRPKLTESLSWSDVKTFTNRPFSGIGSKRMSRGRRVAPVLEGDWSHEGPPRTAQSELGGASRYRGAMSPEARQRPGSVGGYISPGYYSHGGQPHFPYGQQQLPPGKYPPPPDSGWYSQQNYYRSLDHWGHPAPDSGGEYHAGSPMQYQPPPMMINYSPPPGHGMPMYAGPPNVPGEGGMGVGRDVWQQQQQQQQQEEQSNQADIMLVHGDEVEEMSSVRNSGNTGNVEGGGGEVKAVRRDEKLMGAVPREDVIGVASTLRAVSEEVGQGGEGGGSLAGRRTEVLFGADEDFERPPSGFSAEAPSDAVSNSPQAGARSLANPPSDRRLDMHVGFEEGGVSSADKTGDEEEGGGGEVAIFAKQMLQSMSEIAASQKPTVTADTEEAWSKRMSGELRESMLNFSGNWKRNRDMVDNQSEKVVDVLMVVAFLGSLCALISNEYVLQGVPADSEIVNAWKLCNSVFSFFAVVCVYRYHVLRELFQRIEDHLNRGIMMSTDVKVVTILRSPTFWVEIILMAVHLPPYTSFLWLTDNMGAPHVYRGETIMCLLNTLRIYPMMRVIRYRVLKQLPKRHTVSRFTLVNIKTYFAFKMVLKGWTAVVTIGSFWLACMIVLGYWYRCVEIRACLLAGDFTTSDPLCQKVEARAIEMEAVGGAGFGDQPNDLFYQNAVWFIFVSSTTVGYGDMTPSTHFGRVIASICIVIGLVLTALLTAGLANALEFSFEEQAAINLCNRELAKQQLVVHAARIVQIWWKRRQIQRGTDSLEKKRKMVKDISFDVWKIKQQFKRAQRQVLVEIEDTAAYNTKIDNISRRAKISAKVLDSMADRVWLDIPMTGITKKNQGRRTSVIAEVFKTMTKGELADVQRDLQRATSDETVRSSVTSGSGGGGPEYYKAGDEYKDKNKKLVRADSIHQRRQQKAMRVVRLGFFGRLKHAMVDHLIFVTHLCSDIPWTNRELLDRQKTVVARILAAVGFLGCVGSIIENELIFRDVDPSDPAIEVIKLVVLCTSALALAILYHYYWITHLFLQISRHIDKGEPLQTRSMHSRIIRDWNFWAEFFVISVHAPPLVTFEVPLSSMSNTVVYHIETLACIFVSFRLYLLWRVVRDYNLSLMPKRHTVARFSGIHMDSSLALKRLLNGFQSFVFIGILWVFTIIVLGYWYRLFEVTSCLLSSSKHEICKEESAKVWNLYGKVFLKENDLYLQNSFWFMFVTSTTVGYGEQVPGTHMGRTVGALATLLGINYASLLTAALSKAMAWQSEERAALNLCLREQARTNMQIQAATVISLWWRRKKSPSGLSLKQMHRLIIAKKAFSAAHKLALLDIEECADTQVKVDQLSADVKHIESASFAIVDKLWPPRTLGGGRSLLLKKKDKKGTEESKEAKKSAHAVLTTQRSFELKVQKRVELAGAAARAANSIGALKAERAEVISIKKIKDDHYNPFESMRTTSDNLR